MTPSLERKLDLARKAVDELMSDKSGDVEQNKEALEQLAEYAQDTADAL